MIFELIIYLSKNEVSKATPGTLVHYDIDRYFVLGSVVDILQTFSRLRRLSGFVPNCFRVCAWRKALNMPELEHRLQRLNNEVCQQNQQNCQQTCIYRTCIYRVVKQKSNFERTSRAFKYFSTLFDLQIHLLRTLHHSWFCMRQTQNLLDMKTKKALLSMNWGF